MKKIILTLVLIAGIFIVTQAQTRGANHPRKFKQERRLPQRLKQRHKIRPVERRQRAELRRVHRRHKMRKQSRTVMLQEQFNLYKVNAKQAA
jgi:hypothetical protein